MAPTLRTSLAKPASRFQGGLVFCSSDGKPINPDAFAQRDWAQLGHASIQTTLDRYGHLMPDAHAAEALRLERLVFGEDGHAGGGREAADAVQRLQNGSRNEKGVSGGDR